MTPCRPCPPSPPPGVRLPLPEGYSGAVLRRQQEAEPPCGASQGEGEDGGAGGAAPAAWAATAAFSHLHYYNHDAAPLRGDGLRRCLDWIALAAAVHRPVDPAAVGGGVAG